MLLVAVALLALIGHLAGIHLLTAPLPSWRPMTPLGAISQMALGLALYYRGQERLWLSHIISVLPLLIALLALIAITAGGQLPFGGVPLAATFFIATAAIGLLAGALVRRRDLEAVTLALTGMALVAMSLTMFFVNTVGVFAGEGNGYDPRAAVQLTICMLLLGACVLVEVFATGSVDLEFPPWVPVAAGVLSLGTVLFLWRGLSERERLQRVEGIHQALASEARVLVREIEIPASAFRRGAERAAVDSTSDITTWALGRLERDIPSMEAGFRIAEDGFPIVSVPGGADADPVARAWLDYKASTGSKADTVAILPLDSATGRFGIYAPVCTEGRCSGAVVGVINPVTMFQSTLHDSLGAFRFRISGPHGLLQGSPNPPASKRELAVPLDLRVGQVAWRLEAFPRVGAAGEQSNLPGAVLFMGMVVTLLIPVTLQLGRSAWEGARLRERSRLSFALDRATDGLWEMDVRTGQMMRSPTLWRHLQYSVDAVPTDFVGWKALIHPEDQARVEQSLQGHLKGEIESYDTEYRIRAADGTWHTVVDRGRIVDRSSLGAPARLLGISADVTEARAAEKAREESERRFRALFNSGFQFQMLLGCDCKVLEVNQVALERFGTEASTVLSREVWDTLWWSGSSAAQEILRKACESANSGRTEVWEQEIRPEGRPAMILEISLKPIPNAEGTYSQLLLEGRDITERRRAETELKEVDTLTTMGRVAARVAHEINNPLAGIQNAFLLIKDAVPTTHPHYAYVGSIEREIGRISKVTRQLYETYRPEQDTTGMASVQLVVTDAVAFLEQVNRASAVQIVTDVSRVPGAVPVPAAILRQIVYNLVQNAIDASPAGGTVKVIATATATQLELCVQDEGPGVPASLKEQIFEPFFSTKEKEMKTSGMGLGLALVRRTVAAAGGTIAVHTRDTGGAEFVVTLPLEFGAADGAA
jgi:hypothetical protein